MVTEELDGAQWAKLCISTGLQDKEFNATTVDIVFAKAKDKGKRKLKYKGFLKVLSLTAGTKGVEFEAVAQQVVGGGDAGVETPAI